MSASKQKPMTKREARRAVRAHWAEYILNADGPPQGTEEVWGEENERIARLLGFERTQSASVKTAEG